MREKTEIDKSVIKAAHFANWSDLWGFPLAYKLLPFVLRFDFLTPNVITLTAFFTYLTGCIFLFLNVPYHLVISTVLLPLGFLFDDLDGQVARARKMSSKIGDYLDKVLDVLKIYLITASLAYASYLKTGEVIYIFLGFTACFFFNYRYYIKLETMFSAINSDPDYLEKSDRVRSKMADELTERYEKLWKTFGGKLQVIWFKNRIMFVVDEAEFAVFTAFFALLNRIELTLWVLAVSQILIALWRFIERGYQLTAAREELLKPMRK